MSLIVINDARPPHVENITREENGEKFVHHVIACLFPLMSVNRQFSGSLRSVPIQLVSGVSF